MIFSDEIFDVISEPGHGRYFASGFSYSGHPVSCAEALKNIEIIEREGLLERVRELSPYFFEQLETLRDLPLVGDVRGLGLMVCVEFVSNQDTHEGFPDEVDEIVNGLRVAIIAVQPQLLR